MDKDQLNRMATAEFLWSRRYPGVVGVAIQKEPLEVHLLLSAPLAVEIPEQFAGVPVKQILSGRIDAHARD